MTAEPDHPQVATSADGIESDASHRDVDVSVIIPCLNCAEVLPEQLDALAKQDCERGWEVLVADNGSTDGLHDVVDGYRGVLPGLRVVDASGVRGTGHARNEGVRAARGEKMLFPDADDVVGAGYVEAFARALDEHPVGACRLEYERLNDPDILGSRGKGQVDGLRFYRDPPFLPHASGTSLGVRRSAHEAVGGFDESVERLEDTDYCWRLHLAGVSLRFVPEAVLHYRFRTDARGVFEQARHYGRYNVLLYKLYRPRGMPRASLKRGVFRWVALARTLPRLLFRPDQRLRWVRDLAWNWGRIEGCVRYRVLAP